MNTHQTNTDNPVDFPKEEDVYTTFTEEMYDRFPLVYSDKGPTFWGFEIGEGWHPLVRVLSFRINRRLTHLAKRGQGIDFQAAQVKEKFGGLRFYYDGGDDYIHGLVDMAEEMSYKICESCGNKGQLRKGGWMQTLCDEHANGREPANDFA